MQSWLIGLLLLGAVSARAETVRFVFKGAQFGASRMDFGLTASQIHKIKNLSSHEVDFGDVYYVDADVSRLTEFEAKPGFSGVIYPDVPPPARFESDPMDEEADPKFTNQWWVKDLGVKRAWTMATGRGVTIADCDAGYHHDESDLRANLLLPYRYDLSDQDEPYVINDGPYAFHGTAVTAIMAGVRDGQGTNGIAYDSKIVPLQNYNYNSSDDLNKEEATARCVLRAISIPEVDIIVLENQTASGSSETFVGTRDAVRLAIRAGIIVIGAGGNYSRELIAEQKDDTGSIIVGALNKNGSSASWSNYGNRITVSAFGEGLYTLYGPKGAYGTFGGTSGATPQVAAAIALMKEANPGLTPAMARRILENTREMDSGNLRTNGRLYVDRAVENAKTAPVNAEAVAEAANIRRALQDILNTGM